MMKLKKFFLILIFLFSSNFLLANNNNSNPKPKEEKIECNDSHSLLLFLEKDALNLHEKDSNKKIFPASLVKLMTAYLVFEAIEDKKITLDQKITISPRSNAISYVNKVTTLHLKIGDEITIKDALYGMIVKSFNGAAVALAEIIADNEWQFAQKMNQKAIDLGMYNSNFRNASGLHDRGQYVTAYDLKKLIIAIKNDFPQYYEIFGIKEIKIFDKKFISHNEVLKNYKGAEGMKTGFTSISGFNLISSVVKNNDRIFSILLSCESSGMRNKFTKKLLDKAFLKIEKSSLNSP
jgi:D-alanyl-D-alanine carboxypeptidase